MDVTEFRNRAAERAAEEGELVSHAMARMCCHQCGSADGMQEYDEAATRTMPAEQQTGYYRYIGESVPGTIYKPCPVCRRTDEIGISIRYEEWTP